MHIPVLLYKSGVKGVYISRTCFPDVYMNSDLYVHKIHVDSLNESFAKKWSLANLLVPI